MRLAPTAPLALALLTGCGGPTCDSEPKIRSTADGVEWKGRRYASLSAVARAITGTRRNGPAFFGLREAARP